MSDDSADALPARPKRGARARAGTCLLEAFVSELQEQAGLAHARIADDDVPCGTSSGVSACTESVRRTDARLPSRGVTKERGGEGM